MSIIYAAGLLEGEGCFSKHKRSNRPNTILYAIHCEMTDKEPILELQKTFNVGSICYRENKRKDGSVRKASWIWSVQKNTDILFVLESILPYLKAKRRIDKVSEILGDLKLKLLNLK